MGASDLYRSCPAVSLNESKSQGQLVARLSMQIVLDCMRFTYQISNLTVVCASKLTVCVRKAAADGQTWNHMIPQAKYVYNDSTNRSIGRISFEVAYGLHPRGILELRDVVKFIDDSGYVEDFTLSMKEKHDLVIGSN